MVDYSLSLTDNMTLTESESKQTGFTRGRNDLLSFSEFLTKISGFTRTMADTLSFTEIENPSKNFSLVNGDTLAMTEAFVQNFNPPPPPPVNTFFASGGSGLIRRGRRMPSMVQNTSFTLNNAESDRVALNAHTPTIGLFLNTGTPTPLTTIGDLTEASFDGYAAVSSSFGPVFVDGDGALTCVQYHQFNSVPASGTIELVYGAFVANTLGLMSATLFAAPLRMGGAGQAIPFEVVRKPGVMTLSTLP